MCSIENGKLEHSRIENTLRIENISEAIEASSLGVALGLFGLLRRFLLGGFGLFGRLLFSLLLRPILFLFALLLIILLLGLLSLIGLVEFKFGVIISLIIEPMLSWGQVKVVIEGARVHFLEEIVKEVVDTLDVVSLPAEPIK